MVTSWDFAVLDLGVTSQLFKNAVEDYCKPNQFWEYKNGEWTLRSHHLAVRMVGSQPTHRSSNLREST